jgi:lysozyme family protein
MDLIGFAFLHALFWQLGKQMEIDFIPSYGFVRAAEGGNDDDPSDRGGRTSRGITQREYDAWRKQKGKPPLDVWSAPEDDIKLIYLEEYWHPESTWMPMAIDYMFFDAKVNMGPHEAIILLQRALGVADDGRIGPVTRQAIQSADVRDLVTKYAGQKIIFYRGLARNKSQRKFLQGWLNRVQSVKNNALSMLENKS